jgi:hypothetical protein
MKINNYRSIKTGSLKTGALAIPQMNGRTDMNKGEKAHEE